MKILITGASGMVGMNLMEHPCLKKYEVLSPPRKELNLLDQLNVKKYISYHKPDFIINCAGVVGGIKSNIANPLKFFYENLTIGSNLIYSAFSHGVPYFLNIASSCIYPSIFLKPITESDLLTDKLEPTNEGYALAKISALKLCEYISNTNKHLQYKTLIPCNLYGKYDDFNLNTSHMIPGVINKIYQATKDKTDVEIWGTGNARREFMLASDFADAVFFFLENFDKIPQNLNVGVGTDFTIKEYYQEIADIVGFKGDFHFNHQMPEGMQRKLLDISHQKNLNWSPKTTLKNGIECTFNYFLTKK